MYLKITDITKLRSDDIKSDNGFILNTDVDYKDLHKKEIIESDSLFSKKFGVSPDDEDDVLQYLYTCECESLYGQNTLGKVCTECGKEVKKREYDVGIRGWFDIHPYKVLSIRGLNWLKIAIGKTAYQSFLKNELDVKSLDLYENFEVLLNRHGIKKKDSLIKFMLENKDVLFTSSIPVLTKKLRWMMKKNNLVDIVASHELNAPYIHISGNVANINDPMTDHTMKTRINLNLSSIHKNLDEINEMVLTIVGKGKDKIIRNEIYGSRLPYTARVVIVPLNTPDIDRITVPYDVFRGLYKKEIKKELKTMGMPMVEIHRFLDLNICLDPSEKSILRYILKERIKKPYCLINRQPTLDFKSTLAMEIYDLEDGDVLRVPISILSLIKGDFDGDTNSIIMLRQDYAEEIFNYMNPRAYAVSYDRSVTTDYMLNDVYYLLNVGLRAG